MPQKPVQPKKLTKADANAIRVLVNKHLKENNLPGYKLDSFALGVANGNLINVREVPPICPAGQRPVKVHKNGTWYWDCQ